MVVNRVDDVIWALNISEEFVYVSPSVEKLTGFRPEEITGQPISIFLMPASFAKLNAVFLSTQAQLDKGEVTAPYRGEMELLRKDNTTVWTEVSVNTLNDGDGAFVGFAGVIRNITERRKQEAILQAARIAAESANRAKSDFLNNISHEIRTPMNAIIGLSQITLETSLSPEQTNHVKTISNSAKALLHLINDILDLAKIEAGHLAINPDWFSLRTLIGEIVDLFGFSIKAKGLQFNLDIADEVPDEIKGDDLRLRQVLINLIGNAVKFTEQGSITVSVGRVDTLATEVSLAFSVSDTGIGISPEQKELLLQPFVQADPSISRRYGGSGLGLSISARLVELMGGRLQLESEKGKGTCCHFTLPFAYGADTLTESNAKPLPDLSYDDHGVSASMRTMSAETGSTQRCHESFEFATLPCSSDDFPQAQLTNAPAPLQAIELEQVGSAVLKLEELLNTNMLEAQQVAVDLEKMLYGSALADAFAPILDATQNLMFREALLALKSFKNYLLK